MKLYISHGAGDGRGSADVDWFIVEPRDKPEKAIASLRAAGRSVYELNVRPWRAGSPDRPVRTPSHFHNGGLHPGWIGHDGYPVHRHEMATGQTEWEDFVDPLELIKKGVPI